MWVVEVVTLVTERLCSETVRVPQEFWVFVFLARRLQLIRHLLNLLDMSCELKFGGKITFSYCWELVCDLTMPSAALSKLVALDFSLAISLSIISHVEWK